MKERSVRKLRYLLFLAFCSLIQFSARANSCAAQASGNWNSASTWSSCGGGVPGFGDTATIPAVGGWTVTVNDAENVGTGSWTALLVTPVSGITAPGQSGSGALSFAVGGTLSVNGGMVTGWLSCAGTRFYWNFGNGGYFWSMGSGTLPNVWYGTTVSGNFRMDCLN